MTTQIIRSKKQTEMKLSAMGPRKGFSLFLGSLALYQFFYRLCVICIVIVNTINLYFMTLCVYFRKASLVSSCLNYFSVTALNDCFGAILELGHPACDFTNNYDTGVLEGQMKI